MYRHVPNQLTLLRLVLAGVFFLVLNQYRYPGDVIADRWLFTAGVVFVLAAITDLLDGYLARKWSAESTFGRIMDPFCDKVLVLGAYIYLSGPRFAVESAVGQSGVVTMVSGVYTWMVALMLARELLVTAVRSEVESQGEAFGANWFGKVKMALQSVGVPVILGIVWLDPRADGYGWLAVVRDTLVYGTVVATLLSGLPYVIHSARSLRRVPNG